MNDTNKTRKGFNYNKIITPAALLLSAVGVYYGYSYIFRDRHMSDEYNYNIYLQDINKHKTDKTIKTDIFTPLSSQNSSKRGSPLPEGTLMRSKHRFFEGEIIFDRKIWIK